MSEQEHNEYMRNVKWTTFWYVAGTVASLLVGGTFGVAAIKDEIRDSRSDSKIQIQSVYYRLNSKIDSLQGFNVLQFQDIREELQRMPTSEIKMANPIQKTISTGYFTARHINGKLVFIRVQ